MDLVVVAALGVLLWLAIVVTTVVLCRAASMADEYVESAANMAPVGHSEPPLGTGVPAL